MGGETEKSVSAWQVDTLKEYFDSRLDELKARLSAADVAADVRNEQRFTAQQQAIKDALTSQREAVAAALVAAEKAVLVAETNAEKWRGAANEWRGAMNDRERNLMPRLEAEKGIAGVAEKVDVLSSRIDRNEGRASGLMTVFAIIAAIGVLVSIFMAVRG